MSSVQTSIHVDERSTVSLAITFADSAGTLFTPSAVKWTLSDTSGNVINSRENVTFGGALGTTITLKLSDLDLALPNPADPRRVLSILATVAGDPWREEFAIVIDNHVNTVT